MPPCAARSYSAESAARLGLATTITGEVARLLGRPPLALRRYIEDYRDTWR